MKSSISIAILLIFSMGPAVASYSLPGNQSNNIRVVLDHVFISKNEDSIGISEIVVFMNEGQEIYNISDNHTYFAISTPSGVKNLKTEVMECCLVQDDEMVYMDPMKSIRQGETFEMKISYELCPHDKEYIFNKNAVYNTTSLSFFIDINSGVNVEGVHESITLSGKEYRTIVFNDLKTGDTIEMPLTITRQTNYYYVASGLFILALAGLVYHFRGKLFRKKKEYTPEELEIEKRKIFQAIRGFEKHAAGESSEEYKRLMEEYRQKGIAVIMKIDKIKK